MEPPPRLRQDRHRTLWKSPLGFPLPAALTWWCSVPSGFSVKTWASELDEHTVALLPGSNR